LNPGELRSQLERLHPSNCAWARHCCRQQNAEAEEVLQEVYIRVLEGRARYGGRSSFKTWLFGVILRTARERARRGWLRAALLERWHRHAPEREPAPDPELLVRQFQRGAHLESALAALPRRQQQVLHLVFYQDLTIEEAARLLGIGLGSARTHFERGKHRLRELLRAGAAA
jgi:RNA polymerase sigma-70 factor (ECF subfamily)